MGEVVIKVPFEIKKELKVKTLKEAREKLKKLEKILLVEKTFKTLPQNEKLEKKLSEEWYEQ